MLHADTPTDDEVMVSINRCTKIDVFIDLHLTS